jgi:hypothetical protein
MTSKILINVRCILYLQLLQTIGKQEKTTDDILLENSQKLEKQQVSVTTTILAYTEFFKFHCVGRYKCYKNTLESVTGTNLSTKLELVLWFLVLGLTQSAILRPLTTIPL